jgi:hypothetical protein
MSHKKSKKDRANDLRDVGLKTGGGVDYSALNDRQVGSVRHERERTYKLSLQEQGVSALKKPQAAVSSTFDAFQRMAAGLEGRTLVDKMNGKHFNNLFTYLLICIHPTTLSDPNRPTWEQYKKDNEDKLDCIGGEMRKMVEYRAELDRERDRRLAQSGSKSQTLHVMYSDEENESSDSEKSHKKKKSKKKKDKKDKKKHKVSRSI